MSGICTKLRSRLCSTDLTAWNNPQQAKLFIPIFVVAGGGFGILVQSYGALQHVPLPIVWTVFTMLGLTVLAIID